MPANRLTGDGRRRSRRVLSTGDVVSRRQAAHILVVDLEIADKTSRAPSRRLSSRRP
jgi:uncharacterized protein (UPF0218 family)